MAPILTNPAFTYGLGFGIPITNGTCAGSVVFIISLPLGPETTGMVLIHEPGDDQHTVGLL